MIWDLSDLKYHLCNQLKSKGRLDIDLNRYKNDLKFYLLFTKNKKTHKEQKLYLIILPAIVFKYIRYSKFDISRFTHLCVRPDCFNSSAGERPEPYKMLGGCKLSILENILLRV